MEDGGWKANLGESLPSSILHPSILAFDPSLGALAQRTEDLQ
jgi:hypothetical protein